MKVIKYGQTLKTKPTSLILGGFETIHNGHVTLIEEAKKLKKPIAIMLLENPEFFSNKKEIYQPLEDRLQDLSNLGVDIAIVVKMTKTVAATEGNKFLNEVKKSVNAINTFSGADFAMGKNKSLKAKDIEGNTIVDLLKVNNAKISTSLLANDLALGKVKEIKKFTPFGYITSVNLNAK